MALMFHIDYAQPDRIYCKRTINLDSHSVLQPSDLTTAFNEYVSGSISHYT